MRSTYKIILSTFVILLLLITCSSSQEEKEQPKPFTQKGEASYYARMLEGNKTASGEIFRHDSLTAAHNTLPLGTRVKVTNLANDKEVTVRINDRGPYAKHRIIDISRAAAQELEMIDDGVAEVQIEVYKPAEGYTLQDSVVHEQ